jgi:hypothetical protein
MRGTAMFESVLTLAVGLATVAAHGQVITEYTLPAGSDPTQITAGPDESRRGPTARCGSRTRGLIFTATRLGIDVSPPDR